MFCNLLSMKTFPVYIKLLRMTCRALDVDLIIMLYIVQNTITGVYSGCIFFTFPLTCLIKQRLWVLVRTASVRRFLRVPTIYVLSKNKENVKIIIFNFVIFTAVKIAVYCIGMQI